MSNASLAATSTSSSLPGICLHPIAGKHHVDDKTSTDNDIGDNKSIALFAEVIVVGIICHYRYHGNHYQLGTGALDITFGHIKDRTIHN